MSELTSTSTPSSLSVNVNIGNSKNLINNTSTARYITQGSLDDISGATKANLFDIEALREIRYSNIIPYNSWRHKLLIHRDYWCSNNDHGGYPKGMEINLSFYA
jgi:protein tyrosine phosphatase